MPLGPRIREMFGPYEHQLGEIYRSVFVDIDAFVEQILAWKPTAARILEVGCGEGADAIWLARSGWTVTAIDISDVAVSRARKAAERAGARVDWVCGDVLQAMFPARSFGLVSMQYPALPKAAGDAAVRALLDTVRPGGLLLAVYHDLDDEHREHMKSRGVDPADYVGAEDLYRLLGDEARVKLGEEDPASALSRPLPFGLPQPVARS